MADQPLVLVTGAGGHVGGRLFRRLATNNALGVRPLLRQAQPLPEWAAGSIPIIGDLRETAVRHEALRGVTTVVHLATRGFSTALPPTADDLRDELGATLLLAQDAANAGVETFVVVSSIHVFGRALAGTVSDATVPQPTTEYGKSRLAIEEGVAEVGARSGMKITIVRMTNTFGAPALTHRSHWTLLIHDLCRQAVEHQHLTLRTNGYAYRDMMAIEDAVAVLEQIVLRNDLQAGSFVLATSRTMQLREVAAMVSAAAKQLLNVSPTVEVDAADTSEHQHFTLESPGLRNQGILITDSRDEELRHLLQLAQNTFGSR